MSNQITESGIGNPNLQCIDNVQAGHSLPLGMFSVGDCVADNGFEEGFEHPTGLFVDHSLREKRVLASVRCPRGIGWNFDFSTHRNSLDATTTGKTTDSRLGDTLNVVSKDFAVAFGTTLAEALATFSTCS